MLQRNKHKWLGYYPGTKIIIVRKQGQPFGALEHLSVLKSCNQSLCHLLGIYESAQNTEPLHFIALVFLYEEMLKIWMQMESKCCVFLTNTALHIILEVSAANHECIQRITQITTPYYSEQTIIMNLKAFGIQQQKTTAGSAPFSQEQECESTVDTSTLKLESWRLEKDQGVHCGIKAVTKLCF